MTDQEVLDERIREASHTILCCWDEWEADAGQDEQNAQSPGAYFDAMYAQLDAVIGGLVEGEIRLAFAERTRWLEAMKRVVNCYTENEGKRESIMALKALIATA